jgi:hypothetical protein
MDPAKSAQTESERGYSEEMVNSGKGRNNSQDKKPAIFYQY